MRTNPVTYLLVVSCLAILTGCATPAKDVLASADYGPYPTNYQEDLKNLIDKRLKDPYSAHYEFLEPRKGWIGGNLQTSVKTRYGWFVTVRVNARNGFGGYNGFEEYTFFYTDGRYREPGAGGWGFDIALNPTAGYSE
jgi:hypothetical protein